MFDVEGYFKEKIGLKNNLSRLDIILIINAICYALDRKEIKKSEMAMMYQALGCRLVKSLHVDGILPVDENIKQEWSRKGLF